MAKLTVTSIRAQIAALEAKAARLTEMEMKTSVAKVRALMSDLGVTMEHLGARVSDTAKAAKKAVLAKVSSKQVGRKPKAKRVGAGAPKYADPKTGQTWSGFGRAPGWIASVKNRDVYLVNKPAASATSEAAAPKKPAKKATVKAAKASAKTAAKKAAAAVKKTAGKKAPAKEASAKTAAAKKSAAKKATPRARSATAAGAAPADSQPAATSQ